MENNALTITSSFNLYTFIILCYMEIVGEKNTAC